MENKLQVIVNQSGLEQTKAQIILEKFKNYFEIADEWERRAKEIIVKSEDETPLMEMARAGRIFLREKRITIEKTRKEMKEQSLREGKAIDGIANVLKGLIEPIEDYLDRQEHFVEYKRKAEEEQRRIEEEKRIEEERIAKEKAEAEERERIKKENERLRLEAIEKERALRMEQEKRESERLLAEKKANEERLRHEEEKRKLEEDSRKEKERINNERIIAEKKANEEKIILENEKKIIEQKAKEEKQKFENEIKIKQDNEKKIIEEKNNLEQQIKQLIECPFCRKKFNLVGIGQNVTGKGFHFGIVDDCLINN